MSAPALFFALALMAADAPPPDGPPQGEPLPAGAPTQDYPLSAWCYGAMSEYLAVYERVKPDLKAIDKMFGTSEPKEPEPYASDMAAAHEELKVLADAVTAAEKASPSSISQEGLAAVKLGRSIWSPAEAKTNRELARAWLSWALPDRCDSTARALTSKSALLGQALKYNTPPPAPESPPPAESPAQAAPDASPASEPPPQQPSTAVAPSPPPSSTPDTSAQDSQTPPAAAGVVPGAEAAPGAVPPPPSTIVPQEQPDLNAPIPDPTPPRP